MRIKNITENSEIQELYIIMMNPNLQADYATPVSIDGIDAFKSWLNYKIDNVFIEFRLLSDDYGHVLGFMYGYEANCKLEHISVCVVIDEKAQNKGIGAIVALSYENYLFSSCGYGKLYLHIFSFNQRSLMNNIAAGFEIEMILKEYKYFDGRFYDVYVLSIGREAFANKYKDIIRKMGVVVER